MSLSLYDCACEKENKRDLEIIAQRPGERVRGGGGCGKPLFLMFGLKPDISG